MVSIIVPIFNSEKWLNECLNSIARQSYSDFEVLMVDDGSKDISASICQSYVRKDNRFHYFFQDNAGVSVARNTGIEKAKGDYICFIDSDDVVAPDYLVHLLKLSEDGSFSICGYCRDKKKLCGGSKNITRYNSTDLIFHVLNESIDHPNIWMMLFKTNIIHNNHLQFTVGCIRNEDTEFYINYLTYEKTVNISKYRAYYYRPNPTSAMGAPITVKALTSIEASRRINRLLVEKGIISDESIVLSNGVLTYAYALSKSRNVELYDYLHKKYNVSFAMKRMLTFPRISKRFVAFIYLILGKSLFFKFIGFQRLFR